MTIPCDIRGCVMPATHRGYTADGEVVDLCERHADVAALPHNGSSEAAQ